LELLDTLTIPHAAGEKTIEAYRGDLTKLSPDEAIDILVVSAFPDDYLPQQGTLIGALEQNGVSLWLLAQNKQVDLRATHSCWLSGPITSPVPGIRFRRILCFEPSIRGHPPEVVGDIFRSLAPFMPSDPPGTTVAMPLVACGNMGVPIADMVVPLLDAAVNWMSRDFPLRRLKVVAYSSDHAAQFKAIFAKVKSRPLRPSAQEGIAAAGPSPAQGRYDFFVSYAHADGAKAGMAVSELRSLCPSARVFFDQMSLKPGVAWQQEIYEAIENCRHFVPFYSPAYLRSKVCLEEFHLAKFCSLETGSVAIFPIYLHSAELPAYMKMLHYVDCREGDETKLRQACRDILSLFSASHGGV
jgi:hypothetical protein